MPSKVMEEVLQEIHEQGRITFARFMELALFSPHGGYYTAGDRTGARGDYFTSPQAHPAFGALLALQLEQMWELLDRPRPFTVVEPGAGNGLLARDCVAACATFNPEFHKALRYIVIERRTGRLLPSAHALGIQKLTATAIPLQGIVGCILSNELLDTFPVHRFTIQQGALREFYVTADQDGTLQDMAGEPSTPLLAERLARAAAPPLEEGFQGEVNLWLGSWVQQAAQALKRGFVVSIDYGRTARALYSPRRSRGTLSCYYRHTKSANPYQHVGEQDITAHVDFTTLEQEGERHGLTTLGLTTQAALLSHLGMATLLKLLNARELPAHERMANQMAMQQLVQPEGLGELRVLVQTKAVGQPPLYGLGAASTPPRSLEALAPSALPLLTEDHTPLLEGAYPHMAQEVPWQLLWGEEPEEESPDGESKE